MSQQTDNEERTRNAIIYKTPLTDRELRAAQEVGGIPVWVSNVILILIIVAVVGGIVASFFRP